MNRKYDSARFYQSVELLRKYFPNCGITADLITGFPGETDEEFSKTLEFIEKCQFSSMHVFPYSVREGTPAATMPDQISKSLKHSRAHEASAVADKMKNNFLTSQEGKTLEVLFEQSDNEGFWTGHSSNYCLVKASGDSLKNKVCKVQITGRENGVLIGTIL
jgi:threonylcarbamoyladenosine tRNA methylthiotransferase MtaB